MATLEGQRAAALYRGRQLLSRRLFLSGLACALAHVPPCRAGADTVRQGGHRRRSEDLLADVADAFARIEDPAERVRLAFELFGSEGVAPVQGSLIDGGVATDAPGLSDGKAGLQGS